MRSECILTVAWIRIYQEREQVNPPFKIEDWCVVGSSVTSIQNDHHMISHILHFLSLFVVGVDGVIGEAGKSSGASARAGSVGATEGLERMNSPVASSIDARPSSPGDFGDENQPPGNNRDDVEDSCRPRGEIFGTFGGSTDVSRSNFGLSFTREYNRKITNVQEN